MKEREDSVTKMKNIEEKITEIHGSSFNQSFHRSYKEIKQEIYNILKCIKITFLLFKNKIISCLSHLSLLTQTILFITPFLFFIIIWLGFSHLYYFDRIFINDYYNAVKKEYIDYLITEVDSQKAKLDDVEIKFKYNDIENLFFFQIYFKELVTMGLLDQKNASIFTNISSTSETFYQTLENRMDGTAKFSIPQEQAFNKVDNSSNSLTELIKIFYYMFPNFITEFLLNGKYLLKSFLIAYENDVNNTNEYITDENFIYFSFPRVTGDYSSDNIFSPGDYLIDPQIIRKNDVNFENSNDNSNAYKEENWFTKQEYTFRKEEIYKNKASIFYLNMNYNYYGTLQKHLITVLSQNIIHNNKSYYIHVILFVKEINFTSTTLDYNIFLLDNSTYMLDDEKYSNNDYFVISHFDNIELVMSNLYKKYFHSAMKNKNSYFYKNGISFDSFNINEMSEPTENYTAILDYGGDLRILSTVYLFGNLFRKSKYTFSEKNTDLLIFNDSDKINEVCSKFDFNSYINDIKLLENNCYNMEKYKYEDAEKITQEIYEKDNTNIPDCVCLPLFCLDYKGNFNDLKSSQIKKIDIVKEMKIPNKCYNIFNYYQSEQNEVKQSKNLLKNAIIKRYNQKVEYNYVRYKNIQMDLFSSLRFLAIIIVNNVYIETIINKLFNSMANIETTICIIILGGYGISFLITVLVIIKQTIKLSSIIKEFNTIHEDFLFQNESKAKEEEEKYKNNRSNMNNMSSINLLNYNEESPLLSKFVDKYDIKNNETERPLIDAVFELYCKYYNVSKDKILTAKKYTKIRSKTATKITILEKQNELFNLFIQFCSIEPEIIINSKLVNEPFNPYKLSKLYKSFRNSMIKEKSTQKNQYIDTDNVIFELLSTENIFDSNFPNENFFDYGLLMSLNFNYCTSISGFRNSIQQMFQSFAKNMYRNKRNDVDNRSKYIDKMTNNFMELQRNKIEQKSVGPRLIWKHKNILYAEIEKNFELDEEIKLDKLNNCFNTFLLNIYYKYIYNILDKKTYYN